jgi:hypothetical protein
MIAIDPTSERLAQVREAYTRFVEAREQLRGTLKQGRYKGLHVVQDEDGDDGRLYEVGISGGIMIFDAVSGEPMLAAISGVTLRVSEIEEVTSVGLSDFGIGAVSGPEGWFPVTEELEAEARERGVDLYGLAVEKWRAGLLEPSRP